MSWVLCEVCHRVLNEGDGPVCCYCVSPAPPEKPKAKKPQAEPVGYSEATMGEDEG